MSPLSEKVHLHEQLEASHGDYADVSAEEENNDDRSRLSFECHHCQKKFTYTSNLRHHMEMSDVSAEQENDNGGSRLTFECHHCQKKFTYMSNLRHHMELYRC